MVPQPIVLLLFLQDCDCPEHSSEGSLPVRLVEETLPRMPGWGWWGRGGVGGGRFPQ